jgi:photosystem II stability/assembly factor-like uncharacterized protein
VTVTPPPEVDEAPEASELDLELELLIEEARARARARRRRLGSAAAALVVLAGIGVVLAGGGGGADSLDLARDRGRPGGAGARTDARLVAALTLRDLVSAFAFDRRPPGTVYAGTLGGRVYRSRDGGRHWTRTATGGPSWTRVDALATDPVNGERVYAGTGAAVFRTVDGGRSWRAGDRGLLPPPPVIARGQVTATPGHRASEGWVNALAVDPSDGNVIYAGTGGGVRKSTDGGRGWKTVLWHGRYMGISGIAIAPTNPQAVYTAAFVSEPATCGAGSKTPCSQRSRIYKTTDAGKTWRSIVEIANAQGYPTALAVDPREPTTLYAAASSSVLKTTDGGVNWSPITDGLPARRQITALAVDPRRAGTVYVGLYSWSGPVGIFKTTDGGLTWNRLTVEYPVTALAVDPAHPATIFAGVELGRPPAGGGTFAIFKSTDNGRTWVSADAPKGTS